MDPESSGLDDPEPSHGGLPLDRDGELPHEIPHPRESGSGMPHDDQPRVLSRGEVQDLGEVHVEGDEGALLRATGLGDRMVSHPQERLLESGRNVVTGFLERLPPARIQVLVELEPQLQEARSIGSTRSRVISAA